MRGVSLPGACAAPTWLALAAASAGAAAYPERPLRMIVPQASAPGMNDVIGGQVALMFIGLPPAMPHIKTGRVRALAVTGAKRAEAAADLPTMMEAGVPDYSADTWFSVLLPAGASPQIVARLNADLTAITRSPEIRQKLLRMGMEAIQSTPEGCRDYMRAEIKKWGQVVKASGASIK